MFKVAKKTLWLNRFARQTFGGAALHSKAVDHHHHDDHGHHVDHHHQKPSRPPVEYNTVSQFLDHQNLQTYFEVGPGYMKYPGVDSHGHHHHQEYDWRNDPAVNKDIEIDPRDMYIKDVKDYVQPFEGRDEWGTPYTNDTSYLYSNTLVLKPENVPIGNLHNWRRPPYWNPEADFNHEYDYESEDYDYQCEEFRTQHFRKNGPIWQYVIVAFLPVIYFSVEFLYQHYPDEDHWRLNRAPPLNYPDPEDTDDTETFKDYNLPVGRYMVDIGVVNPIWFDIKDGKKVYSRWAGVNPPMEDI